MKPTAIKSVINTSLIALVSYWTFICLYMKCLYYRRKLIHGKPFTSSYTFTCSEATHKKTPFSSTGPNPNNQSLIETLVLRIQQNKKLKN